METRPLIEIIPLRFVDLWELDRIRPQVAEVFQAEVTVAYEMVHPGEFFHRVRNQYHAAGLLDFLAAQRRPGVDKILAVTGFDLFLPILDCVFGSGQIGGPAAVLSSCRLDESYYRRPRDPAALHRRLVTEALHELGHTFGLRHCGLPECIMAAAGSVEEVDRKQWLFCPACEAQLLDARRASGARLTG